MSADKIPQNESRPTGIGPGERLQAARIQQGLTLTDVASRMHLSASILEAIEDNNFEEITAPIFVKGYLRAYARIVSLDEDEMIVQYRDYYSEEDPPINSTSNMTPELSVGDARIKWTTYLVILVLGVLLAAWWWNKEQNNESPISLDTQSSSEALVESDAGVVNSEIEAVSEDPVDSTEALAATAPQPATVEPVAIEPDEPDEPSVAVPEPGDAEIEVEESVTESPETISRVRAEPVQLAPSGSDKLNITVHADTWADIKDSNGYQLVYDLIRADKSVELIGEAPFSVFFGNGHGVEIMFNGEQIDIAPRVRDDNTARLKIR